MLADLDLLMIAVFCTVDELLPIACPTHDVTACASVTLRMASRPSCVVGLIQARTGHLKPHEHCARPGHGHRGEPTTGRELPKSRAGTGVGGGGARTNSGTRTHDHSTSSSATPRGGRRICRRPLLEHAQALAGQRVPRRSPDTGARRDAEALRCEIAKRAAFSSTSGSAMSSISAIVRPLPYRACVRRTLRIRARSDTPCGRPRIPVIVSRRRHPGRTRVA